MPNLSNAEDEETEEFKQQLKMYKEFLNALAKIQVNIEEKNIMVQRIQNSAALGKINFLPPKNLKKDNLCQVFVSLINNFNKQAEQKIEEKTIQREIHIEDKILEIRRIVFEKIKINLNKILIKAESKTEIIVIFLGLLELMKKRDILVSQNDLFGSIEIVGTKHCSASCK